MTHLLDTDTLSIWQSGTGIEHANLVRNLAAHPTADVGVSIISFHEQTLGAHAYVNRARTGADLVRGYELFEQARHWFGQLVVVPFDDPAAAVFDNLRALNLRIGTMDLRIAAITLSRDLTLVTRNVAHFGRVPGLRTEDWTQ